MMQPELPADRPASDHEIAGAVAYALLNPRGYQREFQPGELLTKLRVKDEQHRSIQEANGGENAFEMRVAGYCWRLVTLGILIPHGPAFHMPPESRDLLERNADEGVMLLSRNGLARRLAERCPGLDPVTARYAALSQDCFLAGHYQSASVMLGVATESAMRMLWEACDAALRSSGKTVRLKPDSASGLLDWLEKVLREHRKTLAELLKETGTSKWLDDIPRLVGGGNAIRLTRNEAGHPSDVVVSRDDVQSLLVLFPKMAEGVFALVNALR